MSQLWLMGSMLLKHPPDDMNAFVEHQRHGAPVVME